MRDVPFVRRQGGGVGLTNEARAAVGGFLVALMLVLFVAIRLDSGGGAGGGSGGGGLTPVATKAIPRFWVVRPGQTFGVIAQATGLSVAEIEALNPRAYPASLTVGEHIALRP